MKTRYAAILSSLSLLIAGLYVAVVTQSGTRIAVVQLPRQVWLTENSGAWSLGIWLWLLAIFGWMVLLVTLMWSYLPGHRVSSMLQSGLIIISAVMAIAGLVTWMAVLPYAAELNEALLLLPLVDSFVLGLIGAGLFMGGAVSAWIGFDLAKHDSLNWAWGAPPIAAGLLAVPSPFLLPAPWHLIIAGIVWIGWCFFIVTRNDMPPAFSEWK